MAFFPHNGLRRGKQDSHSDVELWTHQLTPEQKEFIISKRYYNQEAALDKFEKRATPARMALFKAPAAKDFNAINFLVRLYVAWLARIASTLARNKCKRACKACVISAHHCCLLCCNTLAPSTSCNAPLRQLCFFQAVRLRLSRPVVTCFDLPPNCVRGCVRRCSAITCSLLPCTSMPSNKRATTCRTPRSTLARLPLRALFCGPRVPSGNCCSMQASLKCPRACSSLCRARTMSAVASSLFGPCALQAGGVCCSESLTTANTGQLSHAHCALQRP